MDTTCSFVFKDNEFQKDKWKEELVSRSGPSSMLVDRIASGGRDGAFRQHIQQWAGDAGGERIDVSHIYMQAVYCPGECGAINSIDFDCGVTNIDSYETDFALLLEQNNILFVSKNTIPAKHEGWSTISLKDLKSTDFQRLVPADEKDPFDAHPNFTFLGSHIRFGYVTTSTTSDAQDEAVSGIDFWRVTIYHQKGEVLHQNMRVLQLEHNTNVLLQELSDMHEHADKTRREHATQLATMHALQEDVAHERTAAEHLRYEMSEQGAALAKAEAESRSARYEVAQLQERTAAMDKTRTLAMDAVERSSAAVRDLQRQLAEERNRSAVLAKAAADKDAEITRHRDDNERKGSEIIRLNVANAAAADSQKSLKQTIVDMTAEIKLMKVEQEKLIELNSTLQQALADTKTSNARFEELFEMEKKRRREAEQMSSSRNATLKEELRSLSSRMEADLANERTLRIQLEKDHRRELSRIEAAAQAEKRHIEEQVRAEKLSFMQRETELLEEKRNLATSLQAATTKSTLTEQRLSNQLLSVSALHKSEVQRIAHLEAELTQERANRERLESQLPREEEDWEVVEQM